MHLSAILADAQLKLIHSTMSVALILILCMLEVKSGKMRRQGTAEVTCGGRAVLES
jgi:hypothetical protein